MKQWLLFTRAPEKKNVNNSVFFLEIILLNGLLNLIDFSLFCSTVVSFACALSLDDRLGSEDNKQASSAWAANRLKS